jgi:hypothetical protein
LFSLKLKLDNFTLGFWTRYAATAEGCEEVVAVGGGIRTGVGTGAKLNKKGEQTRPLKAKNWRAGLLLNKQTVFG